MNYGLAAHRCSEFREGMALRIDGQIYKVLESEFEEVEQLSDGLGHLYNAQSCRECYQKLCCSEDLNDLTALSGY